MSTTITLIPGDGIGPNITEATVRVLDAGGADLGLQPHGRIARQQQFEGIATFKAREIVARRRARRRAQERRVFPASKRESDPFPSSRSATSSAKRHRSDWAG